MMNDPLGALSWDDLRIAKAIGENGGLAAAAAALGVNHSTVSRRLSAMEAALGVALFDRRRSGYAPTGAGTEIIALGSRLEAEILKVTRRIAGPMQGHTGTLRIATSDALLYDFLTPIIVDFQQQNPQLRIEVAVGNAPLNLARAEADIAFRATSNPPENLYGRKVADIAWAVYGPRSKYLGTSPSLAALYQEKWVSYHGSLFGLRAFQRVEEKVRKDDIVYRADSVLGVTAAICAGNGIGYLPCMHGDLVPSLVRIGAVEPDTHDELWILTHPDIRRSERIYAFMAHCADAIARQRHFIEGMQGKDQNPAADRFWRIAR